MARMATERLKSQISELEAEAQKFRDALRHVIIPELSIFLNHLPRIAELIDSRESTVLVMLAGMISSQLKIIFNQFQ